MNRTSQLFLLVFLSFLLLCRSGVGQTIIKGRVLEDSLNIPLSGVAVMIKNTIHTTSTDDSGYYELVFEDTASIIQFMLQGYETQEIAFISGSEHMIDVKMQSENINIGEVVITQRKVKYSNKNNPAVDLIRNVIKYKDQNRVGSADYTRFKAYDKLSLSASNIPKFVKNFFILKPLSFIFDNYDSVSYPGLQVVPIFIQEQWSDNYLRKSPQGRKKIITDEKRISLDPKFINEEATVARLKYIYDDVELYDNNMAILTNRFLSPIANTGPTFYMFFINDTVTDGAGKRFVSLSFEPRNRTDMLLRGKLLVAIDDQYAVKEAAMNITKFTNINFVKKLDINMVYAPNVQGKYYLQEITNAIQFTLTPKGNRGVFGTRSTYYDSFEVLSALPDSFFTSPEVVKPDSLPALGTDYYNSIRPVPLSVYEDKAYILVDSLKNMRYYKRLLDWSAALISGYKTVGPVDLGPYYRLLSYNPAEGFRITVSARTNPIAVKRFYARGYLAYGTSDQTFKHLGEFIWSVKNKRIWDYPVQYFRVLSQYDSKVPGRVLETSVQDNFVNNIQRGVNDKFLYASTFKMEYLYELPRNVQVSVDALVLNQSPRGSLFFLQHRGSSGEFDSLQTITSNTFGLQIRWAPGERYFFDRTGRGRIPNEQPIFILRGEIGIKDFLQSDYQYQKLSLGIEKRTFLGPLGMIDITLRGNMIFGDLPYPLLNIPRANQSYTISDLSYNLMNYGEFVTDRQVELAVNYRMYGFVLNKIPLLKRLQLRELFGFKLVYGALSDRNNPLVNPEAMQFPTDTDGNRFVHTFTNQPYMEWSVGVGNIFKLLRVDYVQRLSYLDHINVARHGVRFGFLFDF